MTKAWVELFLDLGERRDSGLVLGLEASAVNQFALQSSDEASDHRAVQDRGNSALRAVAICGRSGLRHAGMGLRVQ